MTFDDDRCDSREYTVAILKEMAEYMLLLTRQYERTLAEPIRKVGEVIEMIGESGMELPELSVEERLEADACVMRMLLGEVKVPEAPSLP